METKFRLPVLEECAKVLLAAPNVVTKDVRKEAEKVFLEFRKTAFPYETCRFLLENSRNNFVQFQAVCTIKTSILREWTCLSTNIIEQLRLFLLNYVTTNLSLTPYVREEIFRALALIIKRGILDTENTTSSKIFDEVSQLMQTSNISLQLIACGLLTALLNEFSNHNKTCGTGFTWDFHSKCKLHFEAYHLHQTLLFTLQILNNIVQLTTPYSGDELLVVTRVLSLADDILHWTFLTPTAGRRCYVQPLDMLSDSPLAPPSTWLSTVLNPDFLKLFFKVYSKVHYNQDLSYHASRCVQQLATFDAEKSVLDVYYKSYVQCFKETISGLEIQEYDAVDIAETFHLIISHQESGIYEPSIISRMAAITCDFFCKAAAAEALNADDSSSDIYNKASSRMLSVWAYSWCQDKDPLLYYKQIFEAYVKTHLHDGKPKDNCIDDEVDEDELPDKEKYSDQLEPIGYLASLMLGHSLPILTRLIHLKTDRLKGELERVVTQPTNPSTREVLNDVYDDLHWLVLIATSILSCSKGERPVSVITYMNSQVQQINTQLTQNLIIHPELSSSETVGTPGLCVVAQLVASVLRLFHVQSVAVMSNLAEYLSPQVDATCMYFMEKFTALYLMNEDEGLELSSRPYLPIYCVKSECVNHLVSRILEKIKVNLTVWSSEPDVVRESLNTLINLLSNKDVCKSVAVSTGFQSWIPAISENVFPFNSLPASGIRLLYKAVVSFLSNTCDVNSEYSHKVLVDPMVTFRQQLNSRKQLKLREDDSKLKEDALRFLEMLIGCCSALKCDMGVGLAVPDTFKAELLFRVVQNGVDTTGAILDVYHVDDQLVELAMEALYTVTNHLYFQFHKCETLCQAILKCLEVYVQHNPPGSKKATSKDAEFDDILWIIKLLDRMLTLDLFITEDGDHDPVTQKEQTEKITLAGIQTILPVIDSSLLQYSSLSSAYYRLLSLASSYSPQIIIEFPQPVWELILSSILLSLDSRYGSDVAKDGFEFLNKMAASIHQTQSRPLLDKSKLDVFLQPILNTMLFEPFDLDLTTIISHTLYYLIVLYPAKYNEMQSYILEKHKTEPHFDILHHYLSEFSSIASVTQSTNHHRTEMSKFTESVHSALLELKGLLCVT